MPDTSTSSHAHKARIDIYIYTYIYQHIEWRRTNGRIREKRRAGKQAKRQAGRQADTSGCILSPFCIICEKVCASSARILFMVLPFASSRRKDCRKRYKRGENRRCSEGIATRMQIYRGVFYSGENPAAKTPLDFDLAYPGYQTRGVTVYT